MNDYIYFVGDKMEISTIITIATGIIAGSSVLLKYIAPLTETKVDNRIQKVLVKILRFISQDSDYTRKGRVRFE